jgi:hypothetical protein
MRLYAGRCIEAIGKRQPITGGQEKPRNQQNRFALRLLTMPYRPRSGSAPNVAITR